jgi:hypothetical protein
MRVPFSSLFYLAGADTRSLRAAHTGLLRQATENVRWEGVESEGKGREDAREGEGTFAFRQLFAFAVLSVRTRERAETDQRTRADGLGGRTVQSYLDVSRRFDIFPLLLPVPNPSHRVDKVLIVLSPLQTTLLNLPYASLTRISFILTVRCVVAVLLSSLSFVETEARRHAFRNSLRLRYRLPLHPRPVQGMEAWTYRQGRASPLPFPPLLLLLTLLIDLTGPHRSTRTPRLAERRRCGAGRAAYVAYKTDRAAYKCVHLLFLFLLQFADPSGLLSLSPQLLPYYATAFLPPAAL